MGRSTKQGRRKKADPVAIGAILQYPARAGNGREGAVVRVVAECRKGWYVIERWIGEGRVARRRVKQTHLSSRSDELL